MALSRKFVIWVAVLIGGVLTLGLLSIWNLVSLYSTAAGAAAEYTAMDRADAAGAQVKWLHTAVRPGCNRPDVPFRRRRRGRAQRAWRLLPLFRRPADADGHRTGEHQRHQRGERHWRACDALRRISGRDRDGRRSDEPHGHGHR